MTIIMFIRSVTDYEICAFQIKKSAKFHFKNEGQGQDWEELALRHTTTIVGIRDIFPEFEVLGSIAFSQMNHMHITLKYIQLER